MAMRKWWSGRVFSIGYRQHGSPAVTVPTVGITVEVTDGTQVGRKVDIDLSPEKARGFAADLLKAADQVEAQINRSAIARDAAAFRATD